MMQADFSLDYDVLTVEQPQKLYLMARLTSGPAPNDHQRRPLNLSLVVDRSGSMAGDKIDFTRQAAQFLVQNLGVRDILSVVLYNESVETLLPPEPVTRKDVITQRIANIKASGTTNLSGGWLEGCTRVAQNLNDQSLNRVILMSDGLANRGITDTNRLVTLAQQKRAEGISTTTMGLGKDFNEDLMMAMANAGGGAFYFIESPEVAPTIFQEELQGLLSVVGQNLVISVEPSDYVTTVHQLNAYPMHTNGRQVSFRLGDVFGDEVKALLLELSIPALKDIGQRQIATLRFEYDEIKSGATEHRVWELPVIINIAPEDQVPALANLEVKQSVLLLKAAQARREAVQAADHGQFQTASEILRSAVKAIDEALMTEDEQLSEERSALLQQAADIEQGTSNYNEYSRKTMSTQAFYTMHSRHEDTVVLRMRERERQQNPAGKQTGTTPTCVTWNNQTIKLTGDLMRFGRASQNEVVIDVTGVSRFHCQIKRQDNQWMLEDLGSTNGTFVDGKPIKEPYALSVGDEVQICNEKLLFHDEAPLPS